MLASTRTTFRYVVSVATLSTSSRLRRSPKAVSRCHRTLHAFCLKPESTPSASCSVMSNVLDEPMRLPCSTLASRWPIPCYTPPPTLAHMLRNVVSNPYVIIEIGSLCASVSGSSHAQSLLAMTAVVARAMKTPDRHTCCWKRRATSPPVPHAVSLSRPRFIEPRRPSRPLPQEVRLNRWHENSKAVFPPTNPAHVPAQSPR